jgi:hypothetical protein
MLKTNTVLTAACVVLLTLVSWIGKCIWDDVATIKAATIATSAQVQTMSKELDDHENRIRQTEHDVTILQQQQREDRTARSPKMSDTKP